MNTASLFMIIFSSAMIQASAGFGFSLVSYPFLALLFSAKDCTILITLLSLPANLSIVIRQYKQLLLKPMALLFCAGCLAVPLGVTLVRSADGRIIKLAFAFMILAFALVQLCGLSFRISDKRLSYATAGLLSGFMQGAAAMAGPPVVLFLNGEGMEKNRMRGNLAFYGILISTLTILFYLSQGMIDLDLSDYALPMAVALASGTVAGHLLIRLIPEKVFHRGVLLLIMAAALNQILRFLS